MGRRLLCAVMCLMLFACAPARAEGDAARTDNWYEIFVRSYRDGDGDGVGDLSGVTEKLDELTALSIGGVWLMPIFPAMSYHGYDVTDYCTINPEYGTLDDFTALMNAAHARGIAVILDLPVNHTGSDHPWFLSAKTGADSPYRDYYVWSDTAKSGYAEMNGAYYECRFTDTMPDLNLDNPAVRAEIEKMISFWLNLGADGFRLDAVTSYYTDQLAKNIQFIAWLNDTAKAVKPDCFIVGEAWSGLTTIDEYYKSGADAFFLFPVAQRTGSICKIINQSKQKGKAFGETLELIDYYLGDEWLAPFIANHDTPRAANNVNYKTSEYCKFAMGLLSVMRGGAFVYYGDEIGMLGSGADPNKRVGYFWDDSEPITHLPDGATDAKYPFGSLAAQKADPDSIYTYYKAALAMRVSNPAIARGKDVVIAQDDPAVCLIEKQFSGGDRLIAINFSAEEKTLALNTLAPGYPALAAALTVSGEITLNDSRLTLPALGIAVLEKGE